MAPIAWTVLATLVRPHGRRGELVAELHTDFPEKFAERKRVFLLASAEAAEPLREIALEGHWLLKDRVVLKFGGVDSIEDAERLRGLMVAIPKEERAVLEEGAFYIGDLMGCRVVDLADAGRDVGEVVDLDRHSSNAELLVVQPDDGGARPLEIPFVKAYLERVDTAAKRIEMRLPAGLLEINAPVKNDARRADRE